MEINHLKNIIVDQREEIDISLQTVIKRDVRMEEIKKYLSHPNVLIISGVRRCGKSTLATMILEDKKFGYINFDDNELIGFGSDDFNKLLQAFYELYSSDLEYFIFDEIQNIAGWELFITKLRRTKKVLITGSNANLLSKELATHLTGRHIEYHLTTFSFAEYLQYRGLDFKKEAVYSTKQKSQIHLALDEYLEQGGFPEVHTFGPIMAKHIFDDIIGKDILVRRQIRYKAEFKKVAGYLLANYGQEFTFSKLKHIFAIKNVQTLKNYIEYLSESYLIFILERFSYKLKQQIIAPKKIYVVDNALLIKSSAEFSNNLGKKMENSIFLELKRREDHARGNSVFYWQDHSGREVDFVVKTDNKVTSLIQSSYVLNKHINTKEREIKSLLEASGQLKCNNLTIVTRDEEGLEKIDGKVIKIIPLANFLLGNI